jgi:hypothetical protein
MKALQASTPTTYGNTNVAEAEQAKAVALSELRGYQEIVRTESLATFFVALGSQLV